MEGLKRYIEAYWAKMPEAVPDEYETPCGTPYTTGVSDEICRQIEESEIGLRFHSGYEYPGSGGTDGWMHITSSENLIAHGYIPPADRPWGI